MTIQKEGGDPLPVNLEELRKRLLAEDIEKIRIEKRQILEKYRWISGDFAERLSFCSQGYVCSFEDVFKFFDLNDPFSRETLGKTIYRLCVEFDYLKKNSDSKAEEKNFKQWNNVFVADMKRLVYLRALVPRTKKILKAA